VREKREGKTHFREILRNGGERKRTPNTKRGTEKRRPGEKLI